MHNNPYFKFRYLIESKLIKKNLVKSDRMNGSIFRWCEKGSILFYLYEWNEFQHIKVSSFLSDSSAFMLLIEVIGKIFIENKVYELIDKVEIKGYYDKENYISEIISIDFLIKRGLLKRKTKA